MRIIVKNQLFTFQNGWGGRGGGLDFVREENKGKVLIGVEQIRY